MYIHKFFLVYRITAKASKVIAAIYFGTVKPGTLLEQQVF